MFHGKQRTKEFINSQRNQLRRNNESLNDKYLGDSFTQVVIETALRKRETVTLMLDRVVVASSGTLRNFYVQVHRRPWGRLF